MLPKGGCIHHGVGCLKRQLFFWAGTSSMGTEGDSQAGDIALPASPSPLAFLLAEGIFFSQNILPLPRRPASSHWPMGISLKVSSKSCSTEHFAQRLPVCPFPPRPGTITAPQMWPCLALREVSENRLLLFQIWNF